MKTPQTFSGDRKLKILKPPQTDLRFWTLKAVFLFYFSLYIHILPPKIFAALTGGDFFNETPQNTQFNHCYALSCPPQAENFVVFCNTNAISSFWEPNKNTDFSGLHFFPDRPIGMSSIYLAATRAPTKLNHQKRVLSSTSKLQNY